MKLEEPDDLPWTGGDQRWIALQISGGRISKAELIGTRPQSRQLVSSKMASDSGSVPDREGWPDLGPQRAIGKNDRPRIPQMHRPVAALGVHAMGELVADDDRRRDDDVLRDGLSGPAGGIDGRRAATDQGDRHQDDSTDQCRGAKSDELKSSRHGPKIARAPPSMRSSGYPAPIMKTSVTWLNDYLDPPLSAQQQADLLTDAGFPFDGGEVAENGEPWQEIETTSNRGDCLSHLGLAREAALLGGSTLVPPKTDLPAGDESVDSRVTVTNRMPERCPRYTARVIEGVEVKESPEWLRRRLEAIGLVPRNNLVDATNFVLFEFGQPTHVFDLDRLEGAEIVIRPAEPGETFLPIGEGATSIKLDPDDLVIADAARPVALAGVKGGAESSVTSGTTRILIEAATFDPVAVRNTSRRHQIDSDSSYRFERGVHPADIDAAADRLTGLILEIAGGRLCEGMISEGGEIEANRTVSIRPSRCRRILGIDIDDQEIERLLTGLELSPNRVEDAFECVIPPRRLDLEREADLIEEIARTHGLERLPIEETIRIRAVPPRPVDQAITGIRTLLVGLGFHETVTHTLISRTTASPFVADDRRTLDVDDERASAEPTLRPSIVPSLLRVARHNHDLGNADLRLFETASIFDRGDDAHRERRSLGLYVDPPAAHRGSDQVAAGQAAIDVLRTTIDRIATFLGVESVTTTPTNVAGLAPAARIDFDGVEVGHLGVVDASTGKAQGHENPVAVANLELAPDGLARRLDAWPGDVMARPLPAFPSIDRDLTVVIDEEVPWASLEEAVANAKATQHVATSFVTVFRGKRIAPGKKAVTLRLTFRADDRTLRHEEVDPGMDAIAQALQSLGGEIPS